MSASRSILIFGLDGATFDLMLPWIDEGYLPCLRRLLREGAWSRLKSTIPPITPCAWSSFMTGKNPGKHGLFDFIEPIPAVPGGFRFTNASSRRAESLWRCLSRHGRRVGVLNVPMTYPPEQVNGYLVSGLDTPDEASPYIYPPELRPVLQDSSIGYRLDLRHVGNMRSDRQRDHILREFHEIEIVRTRALRELSRRYPADFRMIVYSATDQVQHHFWHYMDPGHDKYDAHGAQRYRNAIRDVYVHVDGLIDWVLQEERDPLVIIMSDHGFGPTTSLRLRMNQAFEQAGLLTFATEGRARAAMRSAVGTLDRVLRSTLSAGVKRWIAGHFPRLRVWFESADEARIDWRRTVAYTNEISRSFPTIWLNRNGPGANGERERALQAVRHALTALKNPDTGKPLVSRVYSTRDIYDGPYACDAPDLIPSWWEDGFLLEQSVPGGAPELIVERSTAALQGGVEFAGSHRLEGVLIMSGHPVKSEYAFTGADIVDVAPTVLYLMGLPIPADMDGRPLLEALDADFVRQHPPRQESDVARKPADDGQADDGQGEVIFTPDEAARVAERLRMMGYID